MATVGVKGLSTEH